MADAGKTLRILREAAMLLRATKGRRGTVAYLDDAEDVLVAGDLHGNIENFRLVLKRADLDKHPARHLVLQEFVHGAGRYANGGCTSHQLLDLVAALKCQYPHRVHLLLGNHELAEWTGRAVSKAGIAMNALFLEGVQGAYGTRSDEVYAAYCQLFSSMLLAARTPNRVFMAHSIPPGRVLDRFDYAIFEQPGIANEKHGPDSSVYQLVWGRDVSEDTSQRFAQAVGASLLVTGHIPAEQGYSIPNQRQLIVDCVGPSAACVLFPARIPLVLDQLLAGIHKLRGNPEHQSHPKDH
ncbi:MAG: metallophosphoesterase [Planctomycetota bacterium]